MLYITTLKKKMKLLYFIVEIIFFDIEKIKDNIQ